MDITKAQADFGLVSKNISKATEFYETFLGLRKGKPVPLNDGILMHRFFIGKNLIKISETPKPLPLTERGMERAIGIRLFTLLFDDLEPILARLAENDHYYSKPMDINGRRVVFLEDTDGNALELVQLSEEDDKSIEDRIQIGLCVKDVEATANFYGKVLGFEELPVLKIGEHFTRHAYKGGDTMIKFWQGEETLPSYDGSPFTFVGLRYLTFHVGAIEMLSDELVKKDVKIIRPIVEIDGVVKVLLAGDPDGNCVEFVEYL